jgi:hypothetical protein
MRFLKYILSIGLGSFNEALYNFCETLSSSSLTSISKASNFSGDISSTPSPSIFSLKPSEFSCGLL